ncbi:MAG: hypothetical protein LUF90_00880 [Rikenellaceae bacterium]|nr:hypothetical protein [Rikenellaceae bacterium]
MKIKTLLFTILLLAFNIQIFADNPNSVGRETFAEEVQFSVLDGDIKMTLRRTYSDFQCIGFQYSDKYLNMVTATCLELKREGKKYVVEINYEKERFKKIDKAIEAYLKDLLTRNYERENVPDGNKIWKRFVKDGGVRKFIEIVKPWMDDEYLDSPWNTIYG